MIAPAADSETPARLEQRLQPGDERDEHAEAQEREHRDAPQDRVGPHAAQAGLLGRGDAMSTGAGHTALDNQEHDADEHAEHRLTGRERRRDGRHRQQRPHRAPRTMPRNRPAEPTAMPVGRDRAGSTADHARDGVEHERLRHGDHQLPGQRPAEAVATEPHDAAERGQQRHRWPAPDRGQRSSASPAGTASTT